MGRAQSGFIWEKYVLSQSIKHCAKHINVPRWPPLSLISPLFCLRPETPQTKSKETGEEAEIFNSASSAAVSVFILYTA